MDEQDRVAVRETLIVWYGSEAERREVNEAVMALVVTVIAEMKSCTAVMHYVPTPVNFGNPLSQLATSAVKKYVQVLSRNAAIYKTCANHVIALYKSPIGIAAMGA